MKKTLLFLLFSIVVLPSITLWFSLKERLHPSVSFPSWTTIVHDTLKGITIIKPNTREWFFSSTWTTAQTLGTNIKANAIVNANYFWLEKNKFFVAGHYSSDPTPIDTSYCERDKNLCGYITTSNLHIHEWLTITKEATIAAWPLLLRDGVINTDIKERHSHRQQKTKRTALINSKKGVFFIVTRKNYTLTGLASYIKKNFWATSTAINLDGWPSTSLRTSNTGFVFNEQARLPLFFIIK